jgi:hypothetical protein
MKNVFYFLKIFSIFFTSLCTKFYNIFIQFVILKHFFVLAIWIDMDIRGVKKIGVKMISVEIIGFQYNCYTIKIFILIYVILNYFTNK